jgi:hypothetical protein
MRYRTLCTALLLSAAATATFADTLVLTNGRRIDGELLGVSGREIEFEQRSGSNRRTIRVPRDEIARIEFNEDTRSSGRNDRSSSDTPSLPRGLRERQINVTAREPWTDTGVDVRGGQEIYLKASGEVRWGPNRRDDAAGEHNSPRNPNRPLPDRPAAALIGRVGENGDAFFIGDDPGPFRVRGSGRLFLGINDDNFSDNTGSLRVTVSY